MEHKPLRWSNPLFNFIMQEYTMSIITTLLKSIDKNNWIYNQALKERLVKRHSGAPVLLGISNTWTRHKFWKPGHLQKHGRLKTWTIFCAEKTWTMCENSDFSKTRTIFFSKTWTLLTRQIKIWSVLMTHHLFLNSKFCLAKWVHNYTTLLPSQRCQKLTWTRWETP